MFYRVRKLSQLISSREKIISPAWRFTCYTIRKLTQEKTDFLIYTSVWYIHIVCRKTQPVQFLVGFLLLLFIFFFFDTTILVGIRTAELGRLTPGATTIAISTEASSEIKLLKGWGERKTDVGLPEVVDAVNGWYDKVESSSESLVKSIKVFPVCELILILICRMTSKIVRIKWYWKTCLHRNNKNYQEWAYNNYEPKCDWSNWEKSFILTFDQSHIYCFFLIQSAKCWRKLPIKKYWF